MEKAQSTGREVATPTPQPEPATAVPQRPVMVRWEELLKDLASPHRLHPLIALSLARTVHADR